MKLKCPNCGAPSSELVQLDRLNDPNRLMAECLTCHTTPTIQACIDAGTGIPVANQPVQIPEWSLTPWRIGDYGDVYGVYGVQFDVIAKMTEEGAGEQTILTTVNGPRPETEDKANATLAAAAPELYETLVWALAEIDKHERDYHHTTPDKNVATAEALLLRANPERPTDGQ